MKKEFQGLEYIALIIFDNDIVVFHVPYYIPFEAMPQFVEVGMDGNKNWKEIRLYEQIEDCMTEPIMGIRNNKYVEGKND